MYTETRPVFVPSPRAKSPLKYATEGVDTTNIEPGISFQKVSSGEFICLLEQIYGQKLTFIITVTAFISSRKNKAYPVDRLEASK